MTAFTCIEYGELVVSVLSDDVPTARFPPEIENIGIVVIVVLFEVHIKL